MPHNNQYNTRQSRLARLSVVAVTSDERRVVDKFCARYRLSMGQVVRAALVCAGVLELDSLRGDIPPELVSNIEKFGRLATGED
jgi:hypothetical protein